MKFLEIIYKACCGEKTATVHIGGNADRAGRIYVVSFYQDGERIFKPGNRFKSLYAAKSQCDKYIGGYSV